MIHLSLLPPANEVWGKVKCLQVCVCPQGGAIPACIAGGIPTCLAAGLHEGAIPACIAGGIPVCLAAGLPGGQGFSRPTPKGEVEGGSGPGPHPRGKLRGIWSRPTAKGEVEGDLVWGVPAWGRYACSRGCLVETPPTATAAGGTHPTGMHSCLIQNNVENCKVDEII